MLGVDFVGPLFGLFRVCVLTSSDRLIQIVKPPCQPPCLKMSKPCEFVKRIVRIDAFLIIINFYKNNDVHVADLYLATIKLKPFIFVLTRHTLQYLHKQSEILPTRFSHSDLHRLPLQLRVFHAKKHQLF